MFLLSEYVALQVENERMRKALEQMKSCPTNAGPLARDPSRSRARAVSRSRAAPVRSQQQREEDARVQALSQRLANYGVVRDNPNLRLVSKRSSSGGSRSGKDTRRTSRKRGRESMQGNRSSGLSLSRLSINERSEAARVDLGNSVPKARKLEEVGGHIARGNFGKMRNRVPNEWYDFRRLLELESTLLKPGSRHSIVS